MGRRLVSRAYDGVVGLNKSLIKRDARLVVVDNTVVSCCAFSFYDVDAIKVP